MVVNCPECGKKTALLNDTCEHCGIKVKKCPECGNVVEESQMACDYCGYSFEEQVQSSINEEMPKELKKTATKLSAFAESENKKYHKVAKILVFIGWLLLCVAVAVPIIIIKTNDFVTPAQISTAESVHKVCLVISVIVMFVGYALKELRSIISSSATIRQINALKFDYKKYYSYSKADKNFVSSVFLEDNGEVQLIQAIRYKEDSSKKTIKLIKQLAIVTCFLLLSIFAYIGINRVIDGMLVASLFGSSYSFKLNAPLILMVVFWVMSMVLDWFFNKDMEESAEWLEQLRKKEN